MHYLLYARKSSESDDKQAQSIDDQLKELRALAIQRGLKIVGELTEARSAKAPGSRPVFAEMVARIQAGEADAILCWHVNRLFRNPVDFGTVSWMLQTGSLQEIHTPHQVHRSGDNVLLLSVENGMANQFILDLKKAVVRGLNSKVEKGWFPHKAPEGYRNANAQIEPDDERFALMRKAWELMLGGEHTPAQVHRVMTEEWGYTKKKAKKGSSQMLTRASVYNIFNNVFYAGYFKRNGEFFRGSHVPMITLEEFFQVQALLRRHHQVRHRSHQFAYAGLMECGHCGCAVSGDKKTKRLKSGQTKTYYYYCCTNAKGNCTRKVIPETDVDEQIRNLLDSIRVPEYLRPVADSVMAEWRQTESQVQQDAEQAVSERITELERKRNKLLDLRLDNLISDAEFVEQKERLTAELSNLRIKQGLAEEQARTVAENVENVVTLANYGMMYFEGGEPAMRAMIAKALGTRYVLTNKRLAVEISPAFSPLCELKTALNRGSGSLNQGGLQSERQVWWGTLDTIRTAILRERIQVLHLKNIEHHWQ